VQQGVTNALRLQLPHIPTQLGSLEAIGSLGHDPSYVSLERQLRRSPLSEAGAGRSGIGASSPFPRVPAKVPSPNP
jgi:hypothetical protein